MAEEVQIRGTQTTAKIRNPLAPALLWIPTLGIYSIVWYFKVNKEMAELGKATGRTEELGDSPGTSLIAVLLGWMILVPPFISHYNTFKRQQALRNMTTPGDDGMEAGLGLVLTIFISPVAYYLLQSSLNAAWQAQAGGGGQFGSGGGAPGLPQQQQQQQQPGQYQPGQYTQP